MAHLIDKDALVAEIERIRNLVGDGKFLSEYESGCRDKTLDICNDLLSFLDTLEVKEADLDEAKIGETQIYIEDDGGEPPYDGKQWLDLGCLEYKIPKGKFKDGDNVEVILRKMRKGE